MVKTRHWTVLWGICIILTRFMMLLFLLNTAAYLPIISFVIWGMGMREGAILFSKLTNFFFKHRLLGSLAQIFLWFNSFSLIEHVIKLSWSTRRKSGSILYSYPMLWIVVQKVELFIYHSVLFSDSVYSLSRVQKWSSRFISFDDLFFTLSWLKISF